MKKTALVFVSCLLQVVIFALPGCGTSGNAPGKEAQLGTVSTVQKGEVSPTSITSAELLVIRNESDWATFWNLLHSSYSTPPPLPAIDFNENVIVAVVDAPRTSGGYTITIDDIVPTSSGVTVFASQRAPGQGCLVTLSLAQPFHIVTTPVFSGVASLTLSQSVYSCGQ